MHDYAFALVAREDGTSAPVTLADLKAHLRVDGSDEDTIIQSYLDAAIAKVEDDLASVLQKATCRFSLKSWPRGGEFRLPRYPLVSVTSITYLEESEVTPTTLTSTLYRAETDAIPPRVVMKQDQLFPVESLETGYPIVVTFVAGYEDGAVPDTALHAIRLLAAHWYLHREPVITGTIATTIPEAYRALIAGARLWL